MIIWNKGVVNIMIMNVTNAVKTVTFDKIEHGNFFSPHPNCVYLKIEECKEKGNEFNAIDMEGGHLAYFTDTQAVYALDSEITVSFKQYEFTIEC